MIACKLLFILISFLAHSSLYNAQSWICGGGASIPTRSLCEQAYKSINYTQGGITGGETKIYSNAGDCLVVVQSTNPGAALQQDIEGAFREMFDQCVVSKYNGAYNIKQTFTVEVFFVPNDDLLFGSNMQIGTPVCKKSKFFSTNGLIKPEDCISAISKLNLGQETLGVKAGPASGGLVEFGYGTCSIAVDPINDLPITLSVFDQNSLQYD